ncbi:MAG: KEOPS complex kinase/ATPase Bud32 [Nanoarchaeota archaeon]
MNNVLGRGAEAIIYLDRNKVIKKRIKKNYRLDEIDNKLRNNRTRREAKLFEKAGNNVPKILNVDEKNYEIEMEYVEGKLLRDILNNLDEEKRKEIMIKIGKIIADLHSKDIIHGDLTTSNMILKKDEVYFIDFGLGFISRRDEDKAVDLRLLKQALESTHFEIKDECFNYVLVGYKKYDGFDNIINRLQKVEKRGRYKRKQQVM